MYRRPGRGRVLLLVFVALSTFLITLDFRTGSQGPLGRAKEWSIAVLAPVQRGFATVFRPVGNFFSSIGEIGDLRQRNQRLEEEVRRLRSENEGADATFDENERLTDLMDLTRSWRTMDTVVAQVYSNGAGNYNWAVLIDKGSFDGIRTDMAVISPEGLVGKVVRVTPHEAQVLVIIDPTAAAGARIEGPRDTGTVEGQGIGLPLQMSDIGKDADVSVGDEVVTSGRNRSIFPPGIPIGEVILAQVEGGDPTMHIEVDPYVDYRKLDYVSVLLESGPTTATAQGDG
jgi:rod shape-determining protein MreC